MDMNATNWLSEIWRIPTNWKRRQKFRQDFQWKRKIKRNLKKNPYQGTIQIPIYNFYRVLSNIWYSKYNMSFKSYSQNYTIFTPISQYFRCRFEYATFTITSNSESSWEMDRFSKNKIALLMYKRSQRSCTQNLRILFL